MLRMCGTGKLTHMLRSAPPRATQEAARRYDQAILASYVEITGLDDLTEQEALHCQLPMRMGGRGLRSQEKLAHAAWLASWAQSLSEVILRTNVTSLASLDTCTLPIAGHCRDAFEAIPPATGIDDTTDALDWRRWALAPQKKVQKMLCKRVDIKNFQLLLASMDLSSRARLRSCAGPLAGAWQWASPASPSERFEDSEYRRTSRSLLGQPVAEEGSLCQNVTRSGAYMGQVCNEMICAQGHHCYRCARGGGTKSRSTDIEKVLMQILGECGNQSLAQVFVPQWARWKSHCASCSRDFMSTAAAPPCPHCGQLASSVLEEAVLDIETRDHSGARTFIDVTIRHSIPGDSRRLQQAARCSYAVNSEAEKIKHLRYPSSAGVPGKMLPFAMVTFGGFGREAHSFLRSLARLQAQRAESDQRLTAAALIARWAARLAVPLHRANVRCLSSALGTASALRRLSRDFAEALVG